jgi:hypothetical protein
MNKLNFVEIRDLSNKDKELHRTKTTVYSRVCGYCTPINRWNDAKLSEFKDRKLFSTDIKDENRGKNIT